MNTDITSWEKAKTNWTTQEIKYLEEHAHEGVGAIAAALGRSRNAVETQARHYGISLKIRWHCPHCGATVHKPLSNLTGWCYVCTKKVNNEKLAEEVRQLEELAKRDLEETKKRQRLYTRRHRAKQRLANDESSI